MMSPVYLDYNAGAPVRPAVAQAMAEVLAEGGNPSSVHFWGRRARSRVEAARQILAEVFGVHARGVVFTSGGTEANALILRGCGRASVLVSAIEHPSVLRGVDDPVVVSVHLNGLIDLDALDRMLAELGPALVSVMAANNETGIVQPLEQVTHIAHAHGALVHCDAAQAVGRIPISLIETGIDFLTLSACKLGGPSGVGALVMRDPDFPLNALVPGGGQEGRRRGGTENVAGIVGLGIAIQHSMTDLKDMGRMKALRDIVQSQILAQVPGAKIIGQDMPRLPNTLCVALPGLETRTQVMALDLDGVMIGAGSACSSGKMGESAVLKAMGLDRALCNSAIRLSWGWNSGEADGKKFMEHWTKLVQRKGLKVIDAACAA